MSWFKVDDKLHSSRKLLKIPRRHRLAALGLWTLSGSWSSDQLTDGLIPEYMIEEWGGTKTLCNWLVKAGLWIEISGSDFPTDLSFQFHQWDEYQPTKADVEADREKNRDKLRKWRERNRVTSGDVTGLQSGSKPGCNPAPDPTRPDPTLLTEEANASSAPRKRAPRATRIPEGWTPSNDLAQTMHDECPAVDQHAEHRKFIDYWTGKSGKDATKADWDATYRNWIRRAGENAPKSANRATDRMRAGYDAMAGYQGPTEDPWTRKEIRA